MISTVLKKKYKRVHIPRRINRFKFYSTVPFIRSDTLQPLKMDLSFGKGHDQYGHDQYDQFHVLLIECSRKSFWKLFINYLCKLISFANDSSL